MLVWRAVQSIEQLLGAVEQAGARAALESRARRGCGAGNCAMRGRYVRRSALFSTQPVQLALEPRDLDGAGQQPGSDAASEDDEHDKYQRGLEAAGKETELDV